MTFVVPNHFIKNRYKTLKKIDDFYILNHITKLKESRVFARNTMHSLVVLLEGEKSLYIDDKELKIKKGEITLLSQNNYFTSYRVPKEGVYKSLILYFDDKYVFEFVNRYNLSIPKKSDTNLLHIKDDRWIKKWVQSFLDYIDNNISKDLIKVKIEEIFLLILRTKQKELENFFAFVINGSRDRVLHLLENNSDIIFSIEDMCYLTSLSKESLRNYLKNSINTTPKKWLDELRFKKAKALLADKNHSISFIATECGYSSVSWFISKFKERFGVTPREYRVK